MENQVHPLARVWQIVQQEKINITAIYFFALFNGLIQLSLPVGVQAIIGFILSGTLSASLIVLISLIVGGVLMVGLLQIAQMKVIEQIQQRLFVRQAYAFADHIPKLDIKKTDTVYLPELVNRFFDTIPLQKSMAKVLLDLPVACIQIFFGLVLLSFYHPSFILFGLVLVLLLWLILYRTGNKGLESSLAESTHKYAVAGWLEELARVIKSFKFSADTQLHLRKADERTIQYLEARTRHFRVLLVQYRTLVVFKVLITAAILSIGVYLLLQQQINIGQFVAAEIIILSVINAIEKIIINLDSVYDILTSAEKLHKLTDKPAETYGQLKTTDKSISIQATDLSFSYDDKPLIRQVSFSIEVEEKVAISGPEGSGKSTLLKLLSGVYADFSGALLLNGIPLGNYHFPSLRQQMGLFFLSENIFHGTLLENLTMGREVDQEYLLMLIRKTGLQTYFESLPRGFDTELDPTGKRLSMNVIQKIMLIRALAHKPRLLILEEPWRGIEEPFKTSIQQLLLSLPATTVIVATNDPHFMTHASQVIYL